MATWVENRWLLKRSLLAESVMADDVGDLQCQSIEEIFEVGSISILSLDVDDTEKYRSV